jgi:hypothetical protein
MWHRIEYSTFDLPPTPDFPTGRQVHRPIVRLDLVNGPNRLPCYAIVDSGADHCIFPLSFGIALGFDPLTTIPVTAAGIGNSAVATFNWTVTLDFGGVFVTRVFAGFSDGVNAIGFGLLGQLGFFDQVNVAMNYRKKEFFIETDDPPAPQRDPAFRPNAPYGR